jgi:ketosteroid isomerase-like protein
MGNVELAQRGVDAWNRRDLDGLLALCHPDVEWTSAIKGRVEGGEATYRGHEGMRRYWEEWQSIWDLLIEVAEVRESGDRVVVLGGIRTRGASRVVVESRMAFVFQIEDGLIRRLRSYLDRDEALAAAGLG